MNAAPPVHSLTHIALAVRDFDRTVDFYTRAFGLSDPSLPRKRKAIPRFRSLIFASLAMAVTAAPAVAQTITLDCVGKRTPMNPGGKPRKPDASYDRSYRQIFYIDLTSRKYCEGTCQHHRELANADSDIIDLSWQPPEDQLINTSRGDRRFSRRTGEFVTDETYSFGSWSRFKMRGRCTAAPLETVPIIKFLADAPN